MKNTQLSYFNLFNDHLLFVNLKKKTVVCSLMTANYRYLFINKPNVSRHLALFFI